MMPIRYAVLPAQNIFERPKQNGAWLEMRLVLATASKHVGFAAVRQRTKLHGQHGGGVGQDNMNGWCEIKSR